MSTVMVVGSGGREHAIAWKLASSPEVSRVLVAPGNDGMPEAWERIPATSFEELAQRALKEGVRLAVIGPDNALAQGIVDIFQKNGIPTFGPTLAAARIESSKAFAKELMKAAHVPTARYFLAHSAEEAEKILRSVPWPPEKGHGWVIKADGLALGKGVRVCPDRDGALAAARELIALSGALVIEECLQGEEISWLAFCDGTRCALLDPARDYKRLRDSDQGPNTGGMGAFSPIPGIPAGFEERVRREVFEPVLAEMAARGTPFRGVLYAGIMADVQRERLWVLEFNARFGDPETQVLLPRLEGDVFPWFEACVKGDLSKLPPRVPFQKDSAVVVVAAAHGYPEHPESGRELHGKLPERIFYAGVRRSGENLTTAGGRVFGALGMAPTLREARTRAYEHLSAVSFEGMHYRTDIGGRG